MELPKIWRLVSCVLAVRIFEPSDLEARELRQYHQGQIHLRHPLPRVASRSQRCPKPNLQPECIRAELNTVLEFLTVEAAHSPMTWLKRWTRELRLRIKAYAPSARKELEPIWRLVNCSSAARAFSICDEGVSSSWRLVSCVVAARAFAPLRQAESRSGGS